MPESGRLQGRDPRIDTDFDYNALHVDVTNTHVTVPAFSRDSLSAPVPAHSLFSPSGLLFPLSQPSLPLSHPAFPSSFSSDSSPPPPIPSSMTPPSFPLPPLPDPLASYFPSAPPVFPSLSSSFSDSIGISGGSLADLYVDSGLSKRYHLFVRRCFTLCISDFRGQI